MDPSDKFRPEKKEEQFRDFTAKNPLYNRVRNVYHQMHTSQTLDFARKKVIIWNTDYYIPLMYHLHRSTCTYATTCQSVKYFMVAQLYCMACSVIPTLNGEQISAIQVLKKVNKHSKTPISHTKSCDRPSLFNS